ncbi:MAG TPA: MaoC/PaaZ C-terminal domain-containing protein [Candidatus Eremiobacteraceae bacterium]|nr:MaoC/PaaZ C-terminal domain-containing protein [Candidatus Eremiobacteraceae bacterium]
MSGVIATREFSTADQTSFARLSGDANPMHIDRVAARRTEPGEPIVHAIHAILWAIDELNAHEIIERAPTSIDARFARFIYPNTTVAIDIAERTDDTLRFALSADGQAAFAITMKFTSQPPRAKPPTNTKSIDVPSTPIILDTAEMNGRSGILPSMVDARIADAFPNAARLIGTERVKGLAALSALVGMIVPGMHSIFSRFDVDFVDTADKDGALRFEVRKVDDRFRIIDVAVEGSGLSGSAYAFARKPPVEQRSVRDIASIVRGDEFASTKALIVGGSRGLGAATAKIIAAGGGRVTITHLVGEEEGDALVAEISEARCSALRFDAGADPDAQLNTLPWDYDQIYYFATPQVRRQKSEPFERDRFESLIGIQVLGFQRLCELMQARVGTPVTIFYPSTAALDGEARGVEELVKSKAEGEMLCAEMSRQWTEARIIVKRLPPVLTDQTAAVKPAKLLDAVDVMLPIVREMSEASRA